MSIPKDIEKELEIIYKSKKDKRCFAPIYDKYFKQIYLYIFKKVRDESLAGDITSKTFMKALMNLDKYEYQGYPFSAWLYRIASNEVNMHYRELNKTITVEVQEKDVLSLMDDIQINKEDSNLQNVLSVLETLPLEQSQLIDLRFFEQLSFKEIASIYGTNESSIKMKIYRLLEKIKNQIETK